MFEARKLIEDEGLDKARMAARTKADRLSVDAAYAMMNSEDRSVILTSRFVTSLPCKQAFNLDSWTQDAGDATYQWDTAVAGGGLPCGAKSRMILIHLLHEALSQKKARVLCGQSLYSWNSRMQNKTVGGMTYKIIFDHAWRIFQARLSFVDGADVLHCYPVATPIVLGENNLPSEIELNPLLFNHAMKNVVPIRHAALALINNNSSAMDLYIRLADGLPKLQAPRLATWAEIKRRFGAGYKNIRQMRPAFINTLSLVYAVYPEADVSVDERGIVLNPSPAPVVMPV